MRLDILFFERTLADLKKFAFKISKELKQIDGTLKIGSVAVEMPGKDDANEIDCFIPRKDIKNIDIFLKEKGVKMMIFTQTRIPDMEFILHCKKLGIKTIMLQEGVMFDGMNINDVSVANAFAILRYLPKVVEYFHILWNMCKYDKTSFAIVVWHFLVLRKNVTLTIAKEFSEHLICDYIFTMGEYWDDYYITKHGYKKDQIRLIGDHDLDGFKPTNKNEEAICYIANVLVEDGTVKKKDFDVFLNAFADSVDEKTKIYIKLHPRSDKSLYDLLRGYNVTFIVNGALPSVNVYVGHRSALLGRALYESDSLIIWRFACEEICFYEQYATATCTTPDELKKALRDVDLKVHSNYKLDTISKVYWNNPNGSMKYAALLINDYKNNNTI